MEYNNANMIVHFSLLNVVNLLNISVLVKTRVFKKRHAIQVLC